MGFFSDISNCLTHASIGFDGAGELFEARAYTYDLLRAAYLVWIELAGARSGADGPPRLFARRAAPAKVTARSAHPLVRFSRRLVPRGLRLAWWAPLAPQAPRGRLGFLSEGGCPP